MTSVYDFSARAIDGTDVSLDRFRGQALLIDVDLEARDVGQVADPNRRELGIGVRQFQQSFAGGKELGAISPARKSAKKAK